MNKALYDFSTWLSDENFVEERKTDKESFAKDLEFNYALAFADYNSDNRCMGYGL